MSTTLTITFPTMRGVPQPLLQAIEDAIMESDPQMREHMAHVWGPDTRWWSIAIAVSDVEEKR